MKRDKLIYLSKRASAVSLDFLSARFSSRIGIKKDEEEFMETWER